MFKGFRDFLFRGNVVDLAVAVVIGGAFGSVVNAMVKDVITPIIGAIGGTPDFSGIIFSVNSSKFLIGDFINEVISFLIVAAVIYFFVVIPMNKLMEKMKQGQAENINEKACPECLSQIPIKVLRCKYCTAVIK